MIMWYFWLIGFQFVNVDHSDPAENSVIRNCDYRSWYFSLSHSIVALSKGSVRVDSRRSHPGGWRMEQLERLVGMLSYVRGRSQDIREIMQQSQVEENNNSHSVNDERKNTR